MFRKKYLVTGLVASLGLATGTQSIADDDGDHRVPVQAMAAAAGTDAYFPEFDDPHLHAGRAIWLETCKGCHGDGTADAPRPDRFEEWAPRIQQPREVLYLHAIEGFFGPDYSMMPPRGGNPALSDAQVKQAVDYMLRLVDHFRDSPVP